MSPKIRLYKSFLLCLVAAVMTISSTSFVTSPAWAASKYNCQGMACQPPSGQIGSQLPGSPGDTGKPPSPEDFFKQVAENPFGGIQMSQVTVPVFIDQANDPNRTHIHLPDDIAAAFNKLPVLTERDPDGVEYGFMAYNNLDPFDLSLPIIKGNPRSMNITRSAVGIPSQSLDQKQAQKIENAWLNQRGPVEAHTHPVQHGKKPNAAGDTMPISPSFSRNDIGHFLEDEKVRASVLKTREGNFLITKPADAKPMDFAPWVRPTEAHKAFFQYSPQMRMEKEKWEEKFVQNKVTASEASQGMTRGQLEILKNTGQKMNFDVWFAPAGSTRFERVR